MRRPREFDKLKMVIGGPDENTPGKPVNNPADTVLRRPIRARNTGWARAAARGAAAAGLRPNQISVLSVVWAGVGAVALVASGRNVAAGLSASLMIFAGFCVQMRLLCNLLDGLVAVEGGQRTKSGEIYNELPDRVSDVLLLAAAGYATCWTLWERDLGWAAAALSVLVAYTRALGGQAGASQQFCGPMAKQQRMFLLTAACAATALEGALGSITRAMTLTLALISLGCVLTAARRALRIVRELDSA